MNQWLRDWRQRVLNAGHHINPASEQKVLSIGCYGQEKLAIQFVDFDLGLEDVRRRVENTLNRFDAVVFMINCISQQYLFDVFDFEYNFHDYRPSGYIVERLWEPEQYEYGKERHASHTLRYTGEVNYSWLSAWRDERIKLFFDTDKWGLMEILALTTKPCKSVLRKERSSEEIEIDKMYGIVKAWKLHEFESVYFSKRGIDRFEMKEIGDNSSGFV